jgi:hypothetical protein
MKIPVLATDLLFRFEPRQFSHRLPINVDLLRANLIALNSNEGSTGIGDFTTGSGVPPINGMVLFGMFFCPAGGCRIEPRVSTRFQPWETSNKAVRPERARDQVGQMRSECYRKGKEIGYLLVRDSISSWRK